MAETQELRTRIVWDTADAEKGAKRVADAFARVGKAGEDSQKKASGHGSSGGMHSQTAKQNVTAGFRDLAEGRTQFAALRFASAVKLGGAALGFLGASAVLAYKSLSYIGHMMEDTDKAALHLEKSFLKVSKAATFANVGQSTGELGETASSLREQGEGGREQMAELIDLQRFQKSGGILGFVASKWDEFRSGNAGGWLTQLQSKQSTQQKIEVAGLQNQIVGQQLGEVQKTRTESFGLDRDTAYERLRGSPGKAAQMEIDRAEKKEVTAEEKRPEGASSENIAAIKTKYDLQRQAANRTAEDKQTEIGLEAELNTIRKQGQNIEIATAEASLKASKAKVISAEANGNADDGRTARIEAQKAQEELRLAKQTVGERDVNVKADTRIANLRGSTDSNAKQEASEAVSRARELVKLAHTDVEQKQAQLRLAQALRAQEELRRDTAVRRINFERENAGAGIRLGASVKGLSSTRDDAALGQADADVSDAEAGVSAAMERVAVEKGSLDSLQALKQAEDRLRQAQVNRAAVQKEIALSKKDELTSIRAENSATQQAMNGHERTAEITRIRAATEAKIVEAFRQGRTELAAQLRIQGDLAEKAAIHNKFLTPDGNRRRASEIHKEERAERKKARKIKAFDRKLAANGGLINVEKDMDGNVISGQDPITKEQTTPAAMYDRKHKSEKQVKAEQDAAGKGLPDIFQILDARLPSATK